MASRGSRPGWHKATGGGWLDGGTALQGFWVHAVAVPDTGSPAITYDWWRDFLSFLLDNHAYSWFAYVITFGELLVGVALIIGALTGVAAFFGSFMNMSFMLSGSASSNPVLFFLAIGLILAWKVAGYYGVDRYLLPLLGTHGDPGSWPSMAAPRRPEPSASPATPDQPCRLGRQHREAASRKARRFFAWCGSSTTGAAASKDQWTEARTTEAVARTPASRATEGEDHPGLDRSVGLTGPPNSTSPP